MKFRNLFATGLLLTTGMAASAQSWEVDSFETGSSYINNVYYSLKDGVTKVADAKTWHIAFSAARMDAGVITNSSDKGVKVYVLDVDTADFGTDLTSALNAAITLQPMSLYNSNVVWETGAFNQNSAGGFDYGWGEYQMSSHLVKGKSVYAVITDTDTLQIFFQEKNGLAATANAPTYKFKYAQLDGTGIVNKTIELGVPAYEGQNYVYYNFDTDSMFAREPKTEDWNLLFTNYNDSKVVAMGVWYKVFGALLNKENKIANYVVPTVADHDTLNHANLGLTYSDSIAFGYNSWKYAGMSGSGARDTVSFFVQVPNKNIYQVVFTDFVSGTASVNPGLVVLKKRLVYEEPIDTGNSIKNINTSINALAIAPNPVVSGQAQLVIDAKTSVKNVVLTVADVNGRVVMTQQMDIQQGFYQYPLDVATEGKGMFIVTLRGEGIAQSQKLIIQ